MAKGKFGIFRLIILCVIVFVVASVPTVILATDKLDGGEKVHADCCVLTVWNVDTFEGGSNSKASFLEAVALKFGKEQKGSYVLVKNLTVEEMQNNFNAGLLPDILSFGYGIGSLVLPYLEDVSTIGFNGVRSEILNSGKVRESQLAVGYLMGGMILASTEDKLIRSNQDLNKSLISMVNTAGFDKEVKKKSVHIASVILGKNNYINLRENYGFVEGGGPLDDVYVSDSFYDAYSEFVSYDKGAILLGTHRDLFKLSGRIAVGKMTNVKIEYLKGYTNLIQYVSMVKGLTNDKLEVAKKFISFLVSENAQKMTMQVGMINTIGESFYESGCFFDMENVLNQKLIVPNVF